MSIFAQTHPFPPGTDIGDVLSARPGNYKLSLGHMQDLTIESFGLFRAPLWEFGAAMLLGTGLNWFFRRRGSPLKGNLSLTAMMVVVLLCVHQGYVDFLAGNIVEKFGARDREGISARRDDRYLSQLRKRLVAQFLYQASRARAWTDCVPICGLDRSSRTRRRFFEDYEFVRAPLEWTEQGLLLHAGIPGRSGDKVNRPEHRAYLCSQRRKSGAHESADGDESGAIESESLKPSAAIRRSCRLSSGLRGSYDASMA